MATLDVWRRMPAISARNRASTSAAMSASRPGLRTNLPCTQGGTHGGREERAHGHAAPRREGRHAGGEGAIDRACHTAPRLWRHTPHLRLARPRHEKPKPRHAPGYARYAGLRWGGVHGTVGMRRPACHHAWLSRTIEQAHVSTTPGDLGRCRRQGHCPCVRACVRACVAVE